MTSTSRTSRMVVLAALVFICAGGAAAQTIKYNFMEGTDFSKYKTYKWVRVPNAQYPNSIMDDQIKRAIDTQLAAKGLTQTEDNPDLYVTYQVAVDQEKQWNSYSTGGNTWGWGGWGGWASPYSSIDVDQYTERSVVIDIYDAQSRRPIWHGVGSDREYRDKIDYAKLDRAVVAALAHFPPQPATATR